MVRRKTVLLVARRRRRVTLGHVPWPGTQAPQLEDREQQVALAVVHSRVVQLVEEVVHLEDNISAQPIQIAAIQKERLTYSVSYRNQYRDVARVQALHQLISFRSG